MSTRIALQGPESLLDDEHEVLTPAAKQLVSDLTRLFRSRISEALDRRRRRQLAFDAGQYPDSAAIKTRRRDSEFVLPDRSLVTMSTRSMRAYTRLLIRTCHRRGAHAKGGMPAQIPLKDPAAHEIAIAQVEADKHREVHAGHDGTWVAHPGLVPIARDIFGAEMPWANQVECVYNDGAITAADLLARPEGRRTEEGLRLNVRVGIEYLTAWLGGVGCVPLNGLMEDAATAEISRAHV